MKLSVLETFPVRLNVISVLVCLVISCTGQAAALAYEAPASLQQAGSTESPIAVSQDKGWWIIVGSFSAKKQLAMVYEFQAVNAAAARCGLQTFNDFSDKFLGFRSGYNVFVVGPYRTRGEAEHILHIAKSCLPGAYLKYGEYVGE